MLYVREITDLMAAYPGRDFKMAEIVNYIRAGRRLDRRARESVRRSARNALHALSEAGVVGVRYPKAGSGAFALYRWK
jgi:hypothetical protein